jgi:hypothetical protein
MRERARSFGVALKRTAKERTRLGGGPSPPGFYEEGRERAAEYGAHPERAPVRYDRPTTTSLIWITGARSV